MNKTLVIFSIFLFTNFFTIFSTLDCKKKANEIIEKTNNIDHNLSKKSHDFLIGETKNLHFIWKKLEKSLRIYLKRKNLEEIEKKITTLEQNIEFLKIYDAKKSLYQIKRICDEIVKETKPSITNIL